MAAAFARRGARAYRSLLSNSAPYFQSRYFKHCAVMVYQEPGPKLYCCGNGQLLRGLCTAVPAVSAAVLPDASMQVEEDEHVSGSAQKAPDTCLARKEEYEEDGFEDTTVLASMVESDGAAEEGLVQVRSEEPDAAAIMSVQKESKAASKVEESHPWQEWLDFISLLERENYFKDVPESALRGNDGEPHFHRSFYMKKAISEFCSDRDDIFRYLTKFHIRMVSRIGCPEIEGKVVNSSKRLRVFCETPEDEVCYQCKLKTFCTRALAKPAPLKAKADTHDVVRVLYSFAMNAAPDAESSFSFPTAVAKSACHLLKEIVELSACPKETSSLAHRKGNPQSYVSSCPKESKSNVPSYPKHIPSTKMAGSATKVLAEKGPTGVSLFKSDRPMVKEEVEEELQPGDWRCPKCKFRNFRRNDKCLRCGCQPPSDLRLEELQPGDWRCPKCQFRNFRRNAKCLECSALRPKDGVQSGNKCTSDERWGLQNQSTKQERVNLGATSSKDQWTQSKTRQTAEKTDSEDDTTDITHKLSWGLKGDASQGNFNVEVDKRLQHDVASGKSGKRVKIKHETAKTIPKHLSKLQDDACSLSDHQECKEKFRYGKWRGAKAFLKEDTDDEGVSIEDVEDDSLEDEDDMTDKLSVGLKGSVSKGNAKVKVDRKLQRNVVSRKSSKRVEMEHKTAKTMPKHANKLEDDTRSSSDHECKAKFRYGRWCGAKAFLREDTDDDGVSIEGEDEDDSLDDEDELLEADDEVDEGAGDDIKLLFKEQVKDDDIEDVEDDEYELDDEEDMSDDVDGEDEEAVYDEEERPQIWRRRSGTAQRSRVRAQENGSGKVGKGQKMLGCRNDVVVGHRKLKPSGLQSGGGQGGTKRGIGKTQEIISSGAYKKSPKIGVPEAKSKSSERNGNRSQPDGKNASEKNTCHRDAKGAEGGQKVVKLACSNGDSKSNKKKGSKVKRKSNAETRIQRDNKKEIEGNGNVKDVRGRKRGGKNEGPAAVQTTNCKSQTDGKRQGPPAARTISRKYETPGKHISVSDKKK